MGSSGSKAKKDVKEKSESKEENKQNDNVQNDQNISSKNKNTVNQSNNKRESKSIKEENKTNPIINVQNIDQKQLNNINKPEYLPSDIKNIYSQSNFQLPSIMNSIKLNNNENISSFSPDYFSPKKKGSTNVLSNREIKTNQNNENIQKEIILPKMEGQIFEKAMTYNQNNNLNNYNVNFYPAGEHILISFGDTFDIFNNFYTILFEEHQLNTDFPVFNYDNFFDYDRETQNYFVRGIAVNVPNEDYENYTNSEIFNCYNKNSIMFDTINDNKTQNNEILADFLNTGEKSDEFYNEFVNEGFCEGIYNLLRIESEKCNHLHCINFLGDIFSGRSMGLLCNFLKTINQDFNKVLKLCHLKYYDSFKHKAFNKRKNYIYSVSNLYHYCDLVNFLNVCQSGGDIISCITGGERIPEYSSNYSVNQILTDLLINPKMNFIYSNGCQVKEKVLVKEYVKYLYQDCKEDKFHLYYKNQFSSLTIYKGNKIFNNEDKNLLSKEMSKVMYGNCIKNMNYFNFYDINKTFAGNDFIANLHQSEYFSKLTEEYFMDFIQCYNQDNFIHEERELREEAINIVSEIINTFKEIWRCKM